MLYYSSLPHKYPYSVLTFSFPNGTVRTFPAYYLAASNDLYGTRVYIRNATRQIGDTTGGTTITFTGPGEQHHESTTYLSSK